MNKTLRKYLITIMFALLFQSACLIDCYCKEYVKGEIVAPVLMQERLDLTAGDKAIVNLGTKDGLIKGDILQITKKQDVQMLRPIGQCAVIQVDYDSSVCEITKSSVEIEKGNAVSIARLMYSEEKFYQPIYSLLFRISEFNEPYKKVKVYIHDIFDEKGNITRYSERVKGEMERIFSQKNRISLKGKLKTKDFQFYPDSFKDDDKNLIDFMKDEDLDILVTGFYTLENEKAGIAFYRFDRYGKMSILPFQATLEKDKELREAIEVVRPYRPTEKRDYFTCNITYREMSQAIPKEMKREMIRGETEGDALKEYDLKTREFNAIGPVNVRVFFDSERISFGKNNEASIRLLRGQHKIAASFQKGYFNNSKALMVYVSPNEIRKEALLEVRKEDELTVEISLDPTFGKEDIRFEVYKKMENKRFILKPITKRDETENRVEVFRD